jgi:hypothetical protein
MSKKRNKKQEMAPPQPVYMRDSAEAKAIRVLHEVVGRTSAFFTIFRQRDGSVTFTHPMTLQLTKFSEAPPPADWAVLTYQQAAAWEEFLRKIFGPGSVRRHLKEGDRAPWTFPPSMEGKLYPSGTLMTEDDYQNI